MQMISNVSVYRKVFCSKTYCKLTFYWIFLEEQLQLEHNLKLVHTGRSVLVCKHNWNFYGLEILIMDRYKVIL